MAEDIHNPLNNPDALGSGPANLQPEPEPPMETTSAPDDELGQFLDDYYDGQLDQPTNQLMPEPTPEPEPVAEEPVVEEQPVAEEPEVAPEPIVEQPEYSTQQENMELLNQWLRSATAPEPEQEVPQAPLHEQMKPLVDYYVQNGNIDEDYADMWPKEAGIMAYLYHMGGQLQGQVQQNASFTQAELERRETARVVKELDDAIDTVIERGGLYEALKDKTERDNFKRFLSTDVNLETEKINNPDLLARQVYAFYQDKISEMSEAYSQTASQRREPSVTTMQEGNTSRVEAPPQTEKPEFWDMLEGEPSSTWY